MRLQSVCIGIVLFSGLSLAQAPATRDLHFRGDRFKPLAYDTMTPAQKTLIDHLLASERVSLDGPFNIMLRSPEMGDQAQKLGSELRFHSTLPKRLSELAILVTARFWNAQYEWSVHRTDAQAAGLSPAVIDAIAAGRRPVSLQPDEEVVYNFSNELLATRQVSDAAFKAVVEKLGERGAVDLTGLMGYYCFVSMMLNVDRYPLPAGQTPQLKPLN